MAVRVIASLLKKIHHSSTYTNGVNQNSLEGSETDSKRSPEQDKRRSLLGFIFNSFDQVFTERARRIFLTSRRENVLWITEFLLTSESWTLSPITEMTPFDRRGSLKFAFSEIDGKAIHLLPLSEYVFLSLSRSSAFQKLAMPQQPNNTTKQRQLAIQSPFRPPRRWLLKAASVVDFLLEELDLQEGEDHISDLDEVETQKTTLSNTIHGKRSRFKHVYVNPCVCVWMYIILLMSNSSRS